MNQCALRLPHMFCSITVLFQSRSIGRCMTLTRGCKVSRCRPEDVVTHTGQKYDTDDYRMVRFMDRDCKQVNPNWAKDLISSFPPIAVNQRIVACDGRGHGLRTEGHPRVYINLDKPGSHGCIYCGLRFIKE